LPYSEEIKQVNGTERVRETLCPAVILMLVLMRLLFVGGMSVLMLTIRVCSVGVLMFRLTGMGMGVFVLMVMRMLMIVRVLMLSFHDWLLSFWITGSDYDKDKQLSPLLSTRCHLYLLNAQPAAIS
jgi:hypothetical protein